MSSQPAKNKGGKDSNKLDKDNKSKIIDIEKKKFHVWEINPDKIKNPSISIKMERAEGRRRNLDRDEEEGNNNVWVNVEEKYEDEIDCKVNVKDLEKEGDKNKETGRPNDKNEYTHFISIPLVDEKFLDKIDGVFKEMNKISADIKQYFCGLKSLHITVLMLKINSDSAKKKVIEELESLRPEIESLLKFLSSNGLKIAKLGYFADNTKKSEKKMARVIYLEPNTTDIGLDEIRKLTSFIIKRFLEKSIITEEDLRLHHINYNSITKMYELENWHISLVRTRNKGPVPIDDIIKKFENFPFGNLNINRLDLSIRKTHDEEGMYSSLLSFKL